MAKIKLTKEQRMEMLTPALSSYTAIDSSIGSLISQLYSAVEYDIFFGSNVIDANDKKKIASLISKLDKARRMFKQ